MDIGEGQWGTLKILDNGMAFIAVGDSKIPVTLTKQCSRQVRYTLLELHRYQRVIRESVVICIRKPKQLILI